MHWLVCIDLSSIQCCEVWSSFKVNCGILPPEDDFIVHSVFATTYVWIFSLQDRRSGQITSALRHNFIHPVSAGNAGILHSSIINMVMRVNRWQAGQFLSVLGSDRSLCSGSAVNTRETQTHYKTHALRQPQWTTGSVLILHTDATFRSQHSVATDETVWERARSWTR